VVSSPDAREAGVPEEWTKRFAHHSTEELESLLRDMERRHRLTLPVFIAQIRVELERRHAAG
jgi:hypothetical protein